MQINYIVQPNEQLGRIILQSLSNEENRINKAIFISAFVSLQTVLRLKDYIIELKNKGTVIEFCLGIDLGGTSKEVLVELLSWGVTIRLIKNRLMGHTFHPKIYIFESAAKAEIIVGSSNLTEGGFFHNYESSSRVVYDLPSDDALYAKANLELYRFINPTGNIVMSLSAELIERLYILNLIPSESESRARRDSRLINNTITPQQKEEITNLLGSENVPLPPALPAHLLELLVRNVRTRRRNAGPTATNPVTELNQTRNTVELAAFYMTLPTLQGANIPGEARIPLEALELAPDFWGYPIHYTRDESPREGVARVYWNWRPYWRIFNIEHPENIVEREVRMYLYENSSDFRFYARALVNEGADSGDLVRIRRIAETSAEFECVLVRQNSAVFDEWLTFCTHTVRNSTRRFGFA